MEQRDEALRVHSINRAATNTRRRRVRALRIADAYSVKVDPRGTPVDPEEAVRMLSPTSGPAGTAQKSTDVEVLDRDSESELSLSLDDCTVPTLRAMAKQMKLSGYSKANKQALIEMITNNKGKTS